MKDDFERRSKHWQDGDIVTTVLRSSGEKVTAVVKRTYPRKSDGKTFVRVQYLSGPKHGTTDWAGPIWTFGKGAHKLTCLDPGCNQVFYTDDHTKDFCPCCERTMEPRTGSRTKVEQRRDTTRQVVTPVARVSRPPIDEEAAAQQRAIDDAESRF